MPIRREPRGLTLSQLRSPSVLDRVVHVTTGPWLREILAIATGGWTKPAAYYGGRVVPKEQKGWAPTGSPVRVRDGVRNESSAFWSLAWASWLRRESCRHRSGRRFL